MDLKNKIKRYFPLLFQLTRFGIVGLCAAGVHLSCMVFLVEIGHLHPLVANLIALLFGFQVSYFGHRYITFSGTTTLHSVALPKLFFIAIGNFVANEGLFYIFLVIFQMPYIMASLFVFSVLPLANFILGKFWVFQR